MEHTNTFREQNSQSVPHRKHITSPLQRIESAYKSLAETPEGKEQVGRPCRKWENNIKVDRNRICGRGLENDKGPVEDSCEYCNEISSFIKGWEISPLNEAQFLHKNFA
jgi:hypothetical protein